MINRLLIANRGEIAVRIARTARRLGMVTVGVYSEPDRNALHVDSVDVAVALGGATPAESYLQSDALIAAARRTGCDAVHPGYGFLAENADFAEAVIAAGLIWVGPTPDQIRLLGDKIAAKRAAIEAGVPTTPVVEIEADGQTPSDVPLPALVKAAAGGGGRGMRVVRTSEELSAAIESSQREALSAFGDGTVFIEPYIDNGRHVEVQIFGDTHGNVVHLYERDCSVQRRNQKVIEEAPAPNLADSVRTTLQTSAVALAKQVGYVGAGTVEFFVGSGENPTITFLEVNTRLQVEHPVTEAITGFDLVEWQLRVAAGEPLPVHQADITARGHAIEVRVVAEDPSEGWMPSTGTITEFALGDPRVRVDTGFRAGAVVSADYDSLLAKVIAAASTRDEAARCLAASLRGSLIAGVHTNLDALVAILTEPDFVAGGVATSYLAAHPDVESGGGPDDSVTRTLLLAAIFADEAHHRATDRVTGFAPSGWRNLATRGQRRIMRSRGHEYQVEYTRHAAGADVRLGPWPEPDDTGALHADERITVAVRIFESHPSGAAASSVADVGRVVLEVDGVRSVVDITRHGAIICTRTELGSTVWERLPRFADHDDEVAGAGPVSPLPGTVIAVNCSEGDVVAPGQLLMVVEAMKMEHKITAPTDAVVAAVRFNVGDRVDAGDLLVELNGVS